MIRIGRRPFESLPTRIILATFTATLVTSLVVTGISAQSTEAFLRDEIDRKFPAILHTARERLELWYSQRELEVQTFSSSATVVESLVPLSRGVSDPASLEELRTYLAYVLERFPSFQALFVLDLEGRTRVWVGARLELDDTLRASLASARQASVSPLEQQGSRGIQFASAPVRTPRGERLATLHALVGSQALESALQGEDVGTGGGIYVVAPGGRVLLRSPGSPPRVPYARPLPALDEAPVVAQYASASGERVVGAARRFPRFGWTLVVEEPYAQAFAPVVALVRRVIAIDLVTVGIFSLIAFQIARSIVRPIVALSAQARRIADGESGVAIPVSNRWDEIGVLTRAISEMTSRLHRNQLELQEQRHEIERANASLAAHNMKLQQVNEVLEQLSITDGLTRLHNHRFFQDHLPREIKRASRTGEALTLLLIDIDDFKQLNDRWGHAAGDAVLRRVAELMSAIVRDMDLLARYGGEEFALLASQTDLDGAVVLAEKIRREIEEAGFLVEGRDGSHEIGITVSIGVAPFKGERDSLFDDADQALYRAKRTGKNRVVVAGDEPAAAKGKQPKKKS